MAVKVEKSIAEKIVNEFDKYINNGKTIQFLGNGWRLMGTVKSYDSEMLTLEYDFKGATRKAVLKLDSIQAIVLMD